MINCALIGYGKWGKNIFQTLLRNKKININSICKKNIKYFYIQKYKGEIFNSYKKAINNKIDAVFIATPADTHFKIVKYALENKKHVFVEKPVCLNNKNFKVLKQIARKNALVFHVDYIHTFNQNLYELTKKFNNKKNNKDKVNIKISLGKNGPIRNKDFILMDWGPHVFSIINFILNNNKYKTNNISILKNHKNNKINFLLKTKYKNFIVDAFFGNNFSRKITEISITQKKLKYVYKDKFLLIRNKILFNKKNYQTKTPLENSIDQFVKYCKKNKYYHDYLNEKITKELEKIKIKLFN